VIEESTVSGPRLSRRRVLGLGGATAAVVGAGVAGVAVARQSPAADAGVAASYPFYGEHQAGIVTPAQDRLHFVAFDLTTDSREELVGLLQEWTVAAERMTRGVDAGSYGAVGGPYDAPPDDTGEALDLAPSGLTITVGFGRSLFEDASGDDRFGLRSQMPAELASLPHFPGDNLSAELSDGDLCIQACANDPQVAVHAVRNLVRIAFGRAAVRWSQLGFGRTSSTSTSQRTPRNLMGFKDGTANLKAEETDEVEEHLWVGGSDEPGWMAGGTYVVARRIRMFVETWDRTSLREQEAIFGRSKGEGAPLSGGDEFTDPDFTTAGNDGQSLMAEVAHVRLAHPTSNGGARLLRRGYNFVDGSDALGRLDAGLFFVSFQRSIYDQFVPVQSRLAGADVLNEYIQHTGSATFAVPPGVPDASGFWGEPLFA
jgi:deferrochelatase/peroxidase EfeB